MPATVSIGLPFIPNAAQLRPFTAELCLVTGIILNLIVPFATRRPNYACAAVTFLTLALASVCLIINGTGTNTGADLTGEFFRGMLVFDSAAWMWKLTLLPFVAGIVLLWTGHSARTMRQGDAPEFFTLLLGATLGLCLMASTTNLLMIMLAVGTASLPSYLLAGFRKQNRGGAEAAVKYVLFGAVTAAVMIYGLSLLYGLTGSLQISQIATNLPNGAATAAVVASLAVLVGVGFKISAVPFHFWCPDVFEGATIEVTAFLSVASKGGGLLLLLRFVAAISGIPHVGPLLCAGIAIVGAITATVGNTAAFTQLNIKRLLAYSSIAQAGYMLCIVAAVPSVATPVVLFYLVIYSVMNFGAFAISSVVIDRRGAADLSAFSGLGRTSPVLALSMLCCLLSLIGLPPLGGLWAKLNLLAPLVAAGPVGVLLVIAILFNTVISAFYYFRIVRRMYLDTTHLAAPSVARPFGGWIGSSLGTGCAMALVLLFVFVAPLQSMIARNSRFYRPPTEVAHAITNAKNPVKPDAITAAPLKFASIANDPFK